MADVGRPLAPGPVHRFIDLWLRTHALGEPWARPRSELVEAVAAQLHREGFQWLRDAGDLDREVRALAKECEELLLPVQSSGSGYYSARPDHARDWDLATLQDLKRIRALRRRIRRRRWAREAEARRRAGERQITPGALFDLATVTATPRHPVYA